MIQRIRQYVEGLFADAPHTKKAYDLKEEMCSTLIDKFTDLTAGGMPENEAYNVVIGGIGDVDAMFDDLRNTAQSSTENDSARRRNALFVSCAVALYILSIVPVLICDTYWPNSVWGPVLLFVFCAVATALLIYNHMSRPRYQRMDDTMVEEFKEWKHEREHKEDHSLCNAVVGIFWTLLIVLYVLVSFQYGIWAYSWILFLIGAAVDQIIRAVFQLRR